MRPAPQDIKLKRTERILEITWTAGHLTRISIRDLRLSCQCAGCVDEFTRVRTLNPASVPHDLTITAMHLVGNYAIQFTFSDGHDTGIYSWDHLFANPSSA